MMHNTKGFNALNKTNFGMTLRLALSGGEGEGNGGGSGGHGREY